MSYKIILDSCGDLSPELKQNKHFTRVALELEVGGERILDDDTFDQASYIKKVAECETAAKTSCPSPESFMKEFETEAEHVYVVTLSSHLSGSYNSAVLARQMYLEEHPDKLIYVVDSESACCGETLIARKIEEYECSGLDFEEVVEKTEIFVKEMKTYFVLDDLETLRKNGRLSAVKALVASKLNIKPIMGAEGGIIIQHSQAVGRKKAYGKLVDLFMEEKAGIDLSERSLMITHVNCHDRANMLKEMLEKRSSFKDVVIVDAAGVSTTYANDGGVVVTC